MKWEYEKPCRYRKAGWSIIGQQATNGQMWWRIETPTETVPMRFALLSRAKSHAEKLMRGATNGN